jgi:hypothetical protein
VSVGGEEGGESAGQRRKKRAERKKKNPNEVRGPESGNTEKRRRCNACAATLKSAAADRTIVYVDCLDNGRKLIASWPAFDFTWSCSKPSMNRGEKVVFGGNDLGAAMTFLQEKKEARTPSCHIKVPHPSPWHPPVYSAQCGTVPAWGHFPG